MEALLEPIRDWFLPRKDYFEAFAKADTRVEGWFKAELIVLLGNARRSSLIEGFEREVNLPGPGGKRRQIDFAIKAQGHSCTFAS